MFKQSKFYKGPSEPEPTFAADEEPSSKFGDWRDTYDEYMDMPGLGIMDRDKGIELGKKYRQELSDAFGGDKEAMAKALNRHTNYREMKRRERLQKTPSGRDILNNWDKKYDTDADDSENVGAMTELDFDERLRRAMESGALK